MNRVVRGFMDMSPCSPFVWGYRHAAVADDMDMDLSIYLFITLLIFINLFITYLFYVFIIFYFSILWIYASLLCSSWTRAVIYLN